MSIPVSAITAAQSTASEEVPKDARSQIQQLVNQDQVKAEAMMGIAERVQKQMEAGSFWDQIIKDPENALSKEIDRVIPGDSAAAGLAKDLLRGMQSGRFDPESSLAAYSNSAIPNAYSGPATVSGVSGMPLASKSLSSGGKVADGPTSCARSMLVGTISGVARIVTGSLDPGIRAVASAHQLVASLGVAYPELPSSLMLFPAQNMAILLVDKDQLLDQIDGRVYQVLKTALSMKDADYAFDHRSAIIRAQAELKTADEDLASIENVLVAGGAFQPTVWHRAEDNVQDAARILRDDEQAIAPMAKQTKMVFGLTSMNTSVNVLLCRQTMIEEIYGNLSKYPQNFSSFGKPDNLFGSPVDGIRCLLKLIVTEMDAALNRGTTSIVFMKEGQWYLQIKTILAFMQTTIGLSSQPTVSAGGQTFANGLDKDSSDLNNSNDFTALLNLLDAFSSEIRAKLLKPIDDNYRLQRLYDTIHAEIVKQKEIDGALDKRISEFTASFGPEFTQTVTAVDGLANYLKEKDLVGMVRAIRYGDIKGFFQATGKKTTIEEQSMSSVADLIVKARTQSPGDVAGLQEVFDDLRGRARGDQLYRKLTTQYADGYIRDTKEKKLPSNNKMLQTVNRAAAKLTGQEPWSARYQQVQDRISLMEDKVSSEELKAKDTLQRMTQRKPVSCAAR